MATQSTYYEVKDFAAGIDVRKSAITSPAGTLRTLTNAHVTAGGEIEKRSAFVQRGTATPGSFGLVSIGGLLYTLTHTGGYQGYIPAGGIDLSGGPITIGNIWLPTAGMPEGANISDLLDWDLYGGRLYVTANSAIGSNHHFFQDPGGAQAPMTRLDNTGTNPAFGMAFRTYKTKIHAAWYNTLRFSAAGHPEWWGADDPAATPDPLVGAGYIILDQEDSEMGSTQGLEVYYDKLAVFSNKACQLWSISHDSTQNQLLQTLRQCGTIAPQSIRQYGSGDILFLGSDGIRSLKAREQLVSAAVSDIGSPIDPLIRDLYMTMGQGYMSQAVATLQPYTGRYWMVFPDRIFVLSNFPNPKITAWSVYMLPFTVTDVCEAGQGGVFLRASDGRIFQYGAIEPAQYDATAQVEIVTPFLGMNLPATFKQIKAIDIACTGTWQVYAAMNPGNLTAEDLLGTVTGPTFLEGQFAAMGHTTHISLRFRHIGAGPATLASFMIHYDKSETT
jgi:hypothetical protein